MSYEQWSVTSRIYMHLGPGCNLIFSILFSETGAMRRSKLQYCPPPQFRFGEANPRLPYGSWQERREIHIDDAGRKKIIISSALIPHMKLSNYKTCIRR